MMTVCYTEGYDRLNLSQPTDAYSCLIEASIGTGINGKHKDVIKLLRQALLLFGAPLCYFINRKEA